jgi:NAD(P)-dependent dehydrogenase (short-subunit alcohol dehydrogenase family)
MDLELKGRVVLITGGAKGIGAAIARVCAMERMHVAIVDADAAAGRELKEELAASGAISHSITADLTAPKQCQDAIHETISKFGQLDALVNNAGLNDKVGLEHGNPKDFMRSIERNLLHYYCMAHYALPRLKKSQGTILNVASKTAVTGQGGTSGYASSKGGILALTREWAVELLPYGIRVNAIIPSEVITPAYKAWLETFQNSEEKKQGIIEKIPLGKRMTQPEEIASLALFLISSKSSHTTGQHLFVDGGYVHLDRAAT